jgi:PAS domain-containing protein
MALRKLAGSGDLTTSALAIVISPGTALEGTPTVVNANGEREPTAKIPLLLAGLHAELPGGRRNPMAEAGSEISLSDELHAMVFSRGFLNSLSTGYLFFDADGEIIDCNTAAVELLGTEHDQILGHEWLELKSGAVREDGSPLPLDERPSMVSLRSGERCRDVMIGVDNPGQARR